jgi:hypothetical protein
MFDLKHHIFNYITFVVNIVAQIRILLIIAHEPFQQTRTLVFGRSFVLMGITRHISHQNKTTPKH